MASGFGCIVTYQSSSPGKEVVSEGGEVERPKEGGRGGEENRQLGESGSRKPRCFSATEESIPRHSFATRK